jgi:hypothetical protein
MPLPVQIIDTPEQTIKYWRTYISEAHGYDESKECPVVVGFNHPADSPVIRADGGLFVCAIQPGSVSRPNEIEFIPEALEGRIDPLFASSGILWGIFIGRFVGVACQPGRGPGIGGVAGSVL